MVGLGKKAEEPGPGLLGSLLGSPKDPALAKKEAKEEKKAVKAKEKEEKQKEKEAAKQEKEKEKHATPASPRGGKSPLKTGDLMARHDLLEKIRRQKQASGPVDYVLLVGFSLLSLVAGVLKPAVRHFCGWEGLKTCKAHAVGKIWRHATAFDPALLNLPPVLRVIFAADTLVFLPFYLLTVYVLAKNKQFRPWYKDIAQVFCGALIYSTLIYLVHQFNNTKLPQGDLVALAACYSPWVILPAALMMRLRHTR
ncbi:unnamed protein product [Chrysoparadoxa australica]